MFWGSLKFNQPSPRAHEARRPLLAKTAARPLRFAGQLPTETTDTFIPIVIQKALPTPKKYQVPPVSKNFVESLKTVLTNLPEHLRQLIQKNGYKIIAAPTVFDAIPEKDRQTDKGVDRWKKIDGGHFPDRKEIVIGEYFRDFEGDMMRSKRGPATLRHELGHAVDWHRGNKQRRFVNSPQAKTAYREDVLHIVTVLKDMKVKKDRKELLNELEHYLQESPMDARRPRGRGEAFAETFAALLGGGADPAEEFLSLFPHMSAFIQKNVLNPKGFQQFLDNDTH